MPRVCFAVKEQLSENCAEYTGGHGFEVVLCRVMYGKTLSALFVLLIIAAGVTAFVFQTSPSEGKTYTNSVHRYSFTYPFELGIREYTDDILTIGIISDEMVDGFAEARVITAQGEAGQTWQDAVADQLKSLCAADGPDASFSCTDTESMEPFVTANAEQGFVLMLTGEYRERTGTSSELVPKGPYYLVPIISSATISKVLVISPPINVSAAEADAMIVRAIAESVRINL